MTSISDLAHKAAAALGWNAEFIQRQWTLETGHFKSNAWIIDHNPAGIKYYEGMTFGTKGIEANDGGHYAHFDDPAEGYIQFVKHNPRYSHVGDTQDPYFEAQNIAKSGWATDPHYADKIMSISIPNVPAAVVQKTPSYKADNAYYVVKNGDTLSKIANHFHVPLKILVKYNLISNANLVKAGQTVRIPVAVEVRTGDTVTELSRRRKEDPSVIERVNGLDNINKIYIGQTLWV